MSIHGTSTHWQKQPDYGYIFINISGSSSGSLMLPWKRLNNGWTLKITQRIYAWAWIDLKLDMFRRTSSCTKTNLIGLLKIWQFSGNSCHQRILRACTEINASYYITKLQAFLPAPVAFHIEDMYEPNFGSKSEMTAICYRKFAGMKPSLHENIHVIDRPTSLSIICRAGMERYQRYLWYLPLSIHIKLPFSPPLRSSSPKFGHDP